MYTCIYTHTYVFMYMYTHMCVCVYMDDGSFAQDRECRHQTPLCGDINVYVHTLMYTCICTRTYIYIWIVDLLPKIERVNIKRLCGVMYVYMYTLICIYL